MRLTPASERIRVRPVIITNVETLGGPTPQGAQGPLLGDGTPLHASPGLLAPSGDVARAVSLADVTKNFGIGTAMAAPPFTALRLSHTLTTPQLASQFQSFGVAPDSCNSLAAKALDYARSNTGQLTCVFFAGGAVTLGAVEAVVPHWEWRRKLTAAAIGGAICAALGAAMMYAGVWGQPPPKGQPDPPATAQAQGKVGSPNRDARPGDR